MCSFNQTSLKWKISYKCTFKRLRENSEKILKNFARCKVQFVNYIQQTYLKIIQIVPSKKRDLRDRKRVVDITGRKGESERRLVGNWPCWSGQRRPTKFRKTKFREISYFAKLKSWVGLKPPLPTVHCQLFTDHCPLSMFFVKYPLFTACPRFTARCPLPTVQWPITTDSVHYLLPAIYCPPFIAHCLLFTTYCPLFTIHYLPPTIYSHCLPPIFYWPLLNVHSSMNTIHSTVLCLLPFVHCPLSTVHAVYLLHLKFC
jgi:hypothetical protein